MTELGHQVDTVQLWLSSAAEQMVIPWEHGVQLRPRERSVEQELELSREAADLSG